MLSVWDLTPLALALSISQLGRVVTDVGETEGGDLSLHLDSARSLMPRDLHTQIAITPMCVHTVIRQGTPYRHVTLWPESSQVGRRRAAQRRN